MSEMKVISVGTDELTDYEINEMGQKMLVIVYEIASTPDNQEGDS